ncbi:MAG: shikimate dehydrogenase [Gemmatimonadaceae bacterium]
MNRHPGRLVLLGHPVAHSLSPAFQNAALRSAGLPLTYEALDVTPAELSAEITRLVELRAAGNATIPHKETVRVLCDTVTPVAERVGAVNTFWVEDGKLCGDNTDVAGFASSVAGVVGREPRNVTVAVIGAGGSAAAVVAAVEQWEGCRAVVWGRTAPRAAALAARFACATPAATLSAAIHGAGIVVNATPIGIGSDDMPVDPALCRRQSIIVDLVYRRGETPWVRRARRHGLRAIDGLPMLIEQGALAFERWFGRTADREAMWNAVR